jgi:hypothetical protein
MSQLLTGITDIVWQVTSCSEIFSVGFHRLIHGKITTSPANRGIAELESGSFKGKRSRNGRHLERDRFYGSTANVSRHPAVTLSQTLMDFRLRYSSWIWKKRALVR